MKTTKKLLTTLILGVMVVLGSNITAKAATLVGQAAHTTDTITVALDKTAVLTTQKYALSSWTITLQKYENLNYVDVLPAAPLALDATSYTFAGLAPGTKYRAKVDYVCTYNGKPQSPYYKTADVWTAPGKVTGLNQSKWWYYIEKVDFAWDSQDACKYEWVAKQGKKEVKTESNSYYSEGSFNVKNNKLYTVQVRAFIEYNGQREYGEWSDVAYLFTQPMILSRNGISIDGSGKMKIKWDKISGVDKYMVYVSTKEKSGYKKVATVKSKKGSVTVKKFKKKKFKKGKTYYVYVVATKKVGGKTYTSGRHYSTQYKKGSCNLRWSFDGK